VAKATKDGTAQMSNTVSTGKVLNRQPLTPPVHYP